MNKRIFEIQKLLQAAGFNPGKLDGIRGPRTVRAIRQFQASKGLRVDGIVGPNTRRALVGRETQKVGHELEDKYPWIEEAMSLLGLHERTDNAQLVQYLKSDGATLGDPARNPWCGDFVETVLKNTLPSEPSWPANPYAAINWNDWADYLEPEYGCILVFWRGSPSSWKGHIGFYVGEDATHYHVLGGNQTDGVTVSRIKKDRLREGGSRWPKTGPRPRGEKVFGDGAGLQETTNEA